jgi:hypothetical protein
LLKLPLRVEVVFTIWSRIRILIFFYYWFEDLFLTESFFKVYWVHVLNLQTIWFKSVFLDAVVWIELDTLAIPSGIRYNLNLTSNSRLEKWHKFCPFVTVN